MDRLISEHLLKTRLSTGESRPKEITSELIKDIFTVIDAIPSAEPTLDSIRKSIEEYVCNVETDTARAQKMLNAWRAIEYDEPLPSVTQKSGKWIPVSERLPETDNENSINNYNVLLWVKNKSHPEREPQIYLGKLRHIDGDDGSGNFWGIETKPCDWTIWGWCYFNEPEVVAWMPLPKPYEPQERSDIEENMTEVESQDRNLCNSCKTKGCIFQYGIIRSHCDFYKAESEDKE